MKIALSGASGSLGNILNEFFQSKYDIYPISLRAENYDQVNSLEPNIDLLIHLASLNASLKNSNDSHEELGIAKKAIDLCKSKKIGSLIFFSTTQVYESSLQNNNIKIFTEEDKCNPSSIYADAKLDCEKYLSNECQINKINLVILRASPYIDLKSKSKISLLGNIAIKFKLIIEFSKGNENSRSFLTRKNLLLSVENTINYLMKRETLISDTFNLADRYPVSTNEIVNIIAASQGVSPFRIKVPRILELIASKMPFIRNVYVNLISNHSVKSELLQKKLDVELLESNQSILND